MVKKIKLEEIENQIDSLKAGDNVVLTGYLYTARDAAHKRLNDMLNKGMPLPFELKGASIYYAGPTPARPGQAIGSLGPTTSGRMDPYSPRFLSLGLKAMIGKGDRSQAVVDAIKQYAGVYLIAIGGAGALLSQCVTSCEVICFDDLGCESVKKLYVENFPAIVAIDAQGNNIYQTQRQLYYELLNQTSS